MDNGYDSVIFKDLYDNMMYGDIYVIFDPNQVNYIVGQDNTGVDYGPNKFKDLPKEQWKVLVKKVGLKNNGTESLKKRETKLLNV